jgi:hypothetical protein
MFSRQVARPKTPAANWSSLASAIARWLPLPGRSSAESLRVLESVPLTAQTSVALLRCGAETLVLGVTPHRITVLAKGSSAGINASEQFIPAFCTAAAAASDANDHGCPIP